MDNKTARYADQVGAPSVGGTSCVQLCLGAFRPGFVAGAVVGAAEAVMFRHNVPAGGRLATMVAKRALTSGVGFGAAYGGYMGIRCGLEQARGKVDFVNSAVAGGLACSLISLAVLRTPRHALMGAVAGAVVMPIFDATAISVKTK